MKLVSNPPNRFLPHSLEWVEAPPAAALEIYEERAKSIITENKSPDVGFRYSINPYRGCFHACSYCYARPTHQYLGFGAGTDFERKLVVKVNAPELLDAALAKKSWQGETIAVSGNTDCYQPLEVQYQLTRRCLEVLATRRNSASLITKSALVVRDIDVLQSLAAAASVSVTISLAFTDDNDAKLLEPNAPRPSTRLRAMKQLAEAGIEVGVALAPVIPGINDHQIFEILQRAAGAGATYGFMTLLRLPAEVQQVFSERLQDSMPTRSDKCLNAIRDMRAGAMNDSRFGRRMKGSGSRWEAIEWLFRSSCERLGIKAHSERSAVMGRSAHAASPQDGEEERAGKNADQAAGRRQLSLF